MILRNRLLDEMLDGRLGCGLVVTRKEFIAHFPDVPESHTGVFLSNSEMSDGARHSPTWTHFTERVAVGAYRIHPKALLNRLRERSS